MADPSDPMEIKVPLIHASSVELQVMSNEWTFILGQILPIIGQTVPSPSDKEMDSKSKPMEIKPVCILQVSPQTAKDLHLIIKTNIEAYEKKFGAIETVFSETLKKKEK